MGRGVCGRRPASRPSLRIREEIAEVSVIQFRVGSLNSVVHTFHRAGVRELDIAVVVEVTTELLRDGLFRGRLGRAEHYDQGEYAHRRRQRLEIGRHHRVAPTIGGGRWWKRGAVAAGAQSPDTVSR